MTDLIDKPSVCIIGCGRMGGGLLQGLLKDGWSAEQLGGVEADESRRQAARDEWGIVLSADIDDTVAAADIIVLAVKPGQIGSLAAAVRSARAHAPAAPKRLLISIAAGTNLLRLRDWFGPEFFIVRAMPNLPASIGMGMTALCGHDLPSSARETAARVLNAVGKTVWLESEDDIDAVTAVSGSGPAYFFLLMEYMEQAAVESGLDKDTARLLVSRTALGAAHLAAAPGLTGDPAVLRRNVTSPGGTTEAALNVLNEADLAALFKRAIAAARDRARTLSALDDDG